MSRHVPLLSAIALVVLWAPLLFVASWISEAFADFVFEPPLFSRVVLWTSALLEGMALPLLVLLTAFLLSLRRFWGWMLAVALCILWDVICAGLVVYVLALLYHLTEGAPLSINVFELKTSAQLQTALGAAVIVFNQVFIITLLAKRRQFDR